MSGFLRIVFMVKELCSCFNRASEEIWLGSQFLLSRLSCRGVDITPHVRDDRAVLDSVVSAELLEEVKVSERASGHSVVGDAVEVNHSGQVVAFLVPADNQYFPSIVWSARRVRQGTGTNSDKKYLQTIFRISASDFDVSSNPGVSTKVTIRPSSRNGSEYWIWSVQELSCVPTLRFELLAVLMNCSPCLES